MRTNWKTMGKRFLSFLMAFAMILPMAQAISPAVLVKAAEETESETYPSITEVDQYDSSDTFTIATAEEFAALATNVNAGKTYEGKTILVTADLDFSAYKGTNWTPVGIATANYNGSYFKGHFDGQFHHFKNIDMKLQGNFRGLFGVLYQATIENIILDEGTLTAVNSRYSGILFATSNYSTIRNIENHVSLVNSVANEHWAAGFASHCEGTTFEAVVNYGSIIGLASMAGKVQENGGFFAWGRNNAKLSHCYMAGTVSGTSSNILGRGIGTNTNSYYVTADDTGTISKANFASGQTAWNLNTLTGTRSNASIWFATENGPVLKATNTTSVSNVDQYDNYNIFTISTAKEFADLATNVNAGYTYEGKSVRVIADLDFSAYKDTYWTPIGTATSGTTGTGFKGQLNGQFHHFKNINMKLEGNRRGLFGFIQNAAIENIIFDEGTITAVDSRLSGILCGTAVNSVIRNIENHLSFVNSVSNEHWGAGFVSHCSGTTFEAIVNYGSIIGMADKVQENGGFFAWGYSSSNLNYCYMTGTVTGTSSNILARGAKSITNSYYVTADDTGTISKADFISEATATNLNTLSETQGYAGEWVATENGPALKSSGVSVTDDRLTISVFGDSISTFKNVSNGLAASTTNTTISSNAAQYGDGWGSVALEDTWWQQASDALDARILVNNSWAGSHILGEGSDNSYASRCVQLHDNTGSNYGETPDIIAVYLGTNDYRHYPNKLGSAADINYDTLITSDGAGKFTYATPTTVAEAYAISIHKITQRYPDAEIYCFTVVEQASMTDEVTGYLQGMNESISAIAEKYGAYVVDLYSDSGIKSGTYFSTYMADNLHPGKVGMDAITSCFLSAIYKNSKLDEIENETTYTVTSSLINLAIPQVASGSEKVVPAGKSFSCDVLNSTAEDAYVKVTMGGTDITSNVYADGKISIPEVTGDVVITGVVGCVDQQVSLKDDLAMNFVFGADELTSVKVSFDGKVTEYDLSVMTPDENGKYAISVDLAAAQMTEEIQLQLVNSDITVLEKTYSIRSYAEEILAGDYTDSTKNLVKAMLHYGAKAQQYFGVNTDNLANAGYELDAVTLPTEYEEMVVSGSVDSLKFYGASLVFKNKIAVRFYFTGSVDGVSFGDYEVVPKGDMYYVEVADINPQDYSKLIALTATKGEETLTVSYSPLNYILRMSEKGSDTLKDLVNALYGYHEAAILYLRSIGEICYMPVSSDFTAITAEELLDIYTIVDADEPAWTLNENGLVLTSQKGELYTGDNVPHDIFVQYGDGNWIAETKMTVSKALNGNYQQGGLLIYEDANNYIKLVYGYGNSATKIQMIYELDGAIVKDVSSKLTTDTIWLRIKKQDNTYTLYYATDINDGFQKLGECTAKLECAKLGFTAYNGRWSNAEEIDFAFEYLDILDVNTPT